MIVMVVIMGGGQNKSGDGRRPDFREQKKSGHNSITAR